MNDDGFIDLEEAKRRKAQPSPPHVPNPDYVAARLKTLDLITLDGKPVPERRWMVRDWIPHGNVTMLAGDGGIGKSLLAMQLLTCAATGKDWLGRETMPCRAVGVFCEDDADELHRRQQAINEHYGLEYGDLENLLYVPRIGQDNALMTYGKFENHGENTEFLQQIHNLTQDFGAQLLVLDSLHDLYTGNENNRVQARQFVQKGAELARNMDGTVVFTAHPSLDGLKTGSGTSGSTAWNNAARSRLYLTRPRKEDDDPDNDERGLSPKKANYSKAGNEITVRWRDGVFVAKDAPSGTVAAIDRRNAERVFLELLDRTEEENRPVSENNHAGNYAPKMFAKRPINSRQGFNKREFEWAMERLFDDGKIKVEEYGRKSDMRRKIIRAWTELGLPLPENKG